MANTSFIGKDSAAQRRVTPSPTKAAGATLASLASACTSAEIVVPTLTTPTSGAHKGKGGKSAASAGKAAPSSAGKKKKAKRGSVSSHTPPAPSPCVHAHAIHPCNACGSRHQRTSYRYRCMCLPCSRRPSLTTLGHAGISGKIKKESEADCAGAAAATDADAPDALIKVEDTEGAVPVGVVDVSNLPPLPVLPDLPFLWGRVTRFTAETVSSPTFLGVWVVYAFALGQSRGCRRNSCKQISTPGCTLTYTVSPFRSRSARLL
jgi:hypothetical protein